MKKIIAVLLVAVLVLGASVNAFAVSIEDVINGFNNYRTVKAYAQYGSVMIASKSDKGMDIDIDANGEHYDVDLVLNGDVLTLKAPDEEGFTAGVIANFIIDIVETALGYQEGEYTRMINADDEGMANFTLEKDGIEMLENEDGGFTLNISLTQKATPIDLSKVRVKKEDIEKYGFLDDDGSIQFNKGNMHFFVDKWNDQTLVLIGEKDALTENSYLTLIDVLSILYGDSVANAYAAKCPNLNALTDGEGFYVTVNVDRAKYEFETFEDYKYVRFMDYEESEDPEFDNGEDDEIPTVDPNEPEDDQAASAFTDNNKVFIFGGLALIVIIAAAVIIKKKKQ